MEAVFAALPVALIYFSGWAYLTSYLGQFGIDATQIDVSFTTVLVYAFAPLQSPKVLTWLGLLAGLGFIAFLCDKYKAISVALGVLLLGGLACLLFVVKDAAAVSAREMADNVWRGDKAQSVPLVSSVQGDDPIFALYKACRDGRRLRQIIGLANQMFLLCRSDVSACDRGTMFAITSEGRITYTADKVREDVNVRKICDV
ncbi:hypothetical protein [Sinorhizobium medicae]|uniref:hypothetical protein n=2 Tax=Sinorhizobium/Ensifer group TaxID=227292 RepID=UPI001AAEF8A9|nr:hypothetical protein [Sinorhizobium medicae]MBO1959251.1 hypothetical protein [Sinorhizobium medicae]WQO44535.1 hypothetical protein U8C42_15110 [Sinorhizobium medicae]WQO64666.1 hypothetical protein U8C40_16245 [Sinorhizobium medicae]WQP37014.1 hypothetical protein U8C38_13515 [Sinorhizobium medicae]